MSKDFRNTKPWWLEEEKKVHEGVTAIVNHLDQHQASRSLDNLRFLKLFNNSDMRGLGLYDYARDNQSRGTQNRVTLNVIHNMCETVTSKIGKNKPRPAFLTNGAMTSEAWSERRKAKKLTKFCEGVFHFDKFYEKMRLAFLHSAIFGTSAVKIYRDPQDPKKVKSELTFIEELIVDDAESINGEPRQMHQRKWINKDVLISMFPEFASQIENAESESRRFTHGGKNKHSDMRSVVESWHLKSGPNATDGKHAITIQNTTLMCEEYDKDYFPFIFLRWTVRPIGFFGQGLAEQLQGIQLEINKILKTIQVSMHLTSVPKVFVEASSKVITAHLDNEIGGIVKYSGTKPDFQSTGAIPSELFTHVDRLYERAFEIAGISQLSASAKKPSGLDSGKAIRTFNDIETERFMAVAQRYEQSFLDACKIYIDLYRDIAKDTDNFKIKMKSGKFLETLDWNDIDLEDDKFLMQVFPTSSLSSSPAGRLQDVTELLQAGFINKEDGIRLLDFPDLESVTNLETAAAENIDRAIELMIDKGQYVPPEPFQNLELGLKKIQEAYLLNQNEGAPEDKLELLRRWIEDAKALLDKAVEDEMVKQQRAQLAAEQQALDEEAAKAEASGQPAEANPVLGQAAEAPIADLLPPDGTVTPEGT